MGRLNLPRRFPHCLLVAEAAGEPPLRPSQSTNATSVGSWRWCRQADALRTRSESSEYKEAQRPHHHSPLLRRCSCSKCSDPRTGRWRSGMMSVGGRTHFWLEFLPFTPGFIPLQVQTRQTCRSLPNFPLPVGRVRSESQKAILSSSHSTSCSDATKLPRSTRSQSPGGMHAAAGRRRELGRRAVAN